MDNAIHDERPDVRILNKIKKVSQIIYFLVQINKRVDLNKIYMINNCLFYLGAEINCVKSCDRNTTH